MFGHLFRKSDHYLVDSNEVDCLNSPVDFIVLTNIIGDLAPPTKRLGCALFQPSDPDRMVSENEFVDSRTKRRFQ